MVRLMMRIADTDFIERLKMLEKESNDIVKFKIKIMLETILQNRRDLN